MVTNVSDIKIGEGTMRVLVATKETQKARKNDFCHGEEGELVTYGSECDRETVDGSCGCKRSLIGFRTHRATTTFMIADDPDVTEESVTAAIRAKLSEEGWIGRGICSKEEDDKMVELLAIDTIRLYAGFAGLPAGSVIERRGRNFCLRRKGTATPETMRASMNAGVRRTVN